MTSVKNGRFCKTGAALRFRPGTPLISGSVPPLFSTLAEKLGCQAPLSFAQEPEEAFHARVRNCFPEAETASPEGYLLTADNEEIRIFSRSEAGLFYGLQTLLDRVAEDGLCELELYETPVASERGLKLYLPPPTPEGFAEFRKIIDLAAQCKYNFIMLELGGAMEYRSHPEINEGWIEYASVMNEYPGKTLDIQNRFPWRKNSIHTENGGGRVLTQGQLSELAAYCRERYLEVVPEMPSLSHSDYLLTRHRELAERHDDPFPDTCCPSNPEYHRLLFDLLDEVIALLKPRRINIGHDEYYSIGLCPQCKGKSIRELYARDINEIAEYLRTRNVGTIMWGEKLLDSHWRDGTPIGGAACPAGKNMEALPATFPAIDAVDPSVEIFHWYWGVDRHLEENFAARGMNYCFANFNAPAFKDWSGRISAPHARGVCISNWGQTSLRTLQRNGVLYDLAYSSFLLWNPCFGSEDYPDIDRLTFRRLYRLGEPEKQNDMQVLTLCHTVQTDLRFQYFFDGFLLDEKQYYLGDHVFRSGDSAEYRFPVIFGSNISNTGTDPARKDAPDSIKDAYEFDSQYQEISFETFPERDKEGRMWYYCRYLLPASCASLEYLRFEPVNALVPQVQVKSFRLGSDLPRQTPE